MRLAPYAQPAGGRKPAFRQRAGAPLAAAISVSPAPRGVQALSATKLAARERASYGKGAVKMEESLFGRRKPAAGGQRDCQPRCAEIG